MHNHSEKIEPKKLAITIILAILLFSYAYMTRKGRIDSNIEQNSSATSTVVVSQ